MSEMKSAGLSSTGVPTQHGDCRNDGDPAGKFERSAWYRTLHARQLDLDTRLAAALQQIGERPSDAELVALAVHTAQQRSEIIAEIERSRGDVIELAGWFAARTRSTPRIDAAVQHFDAGAYLAARIVMDHERMIAELDALLTPLPGMLNPPAPPDKLQDRAAEFMILARLLAIGEDRVEQFDAIADCFERSLGAAPTPQCAYAYARFLRREGRGAEARRWLESAWSLAQKPGNGDWPFRPSCQAALLLDLTAARLETIDLVSASQSCSDGLDLHRALVAEDPAANSPGLASMLHLAAALARHGRSLAEAEQYYGEALEIRRSLASSSPDASRIDLGNVLNAMGVLLVDSGRSAEAEFRLRQAVEAYRAELWTQPGMVGLPLAMALNNLALLLREKDDLVGGERCCEEALMISRAFGDRETEAHRYVLGATLNNLGLLQQDLGKTEGGLAAFTEALDLRRGLAEHDLDRFGADAAVTALNLSIFHLESMPDQRCSVELAREALGRALPQIDRHLQAERCVGTAKQVLARWGLDTDCA